MLENSKNFSLDWHTLLSKMKKLATGWISALRPQTLFLLAAFMIFAVTFLYQPYTAEYESLARNSLDPSFFTAVNKPSLQPDLLNHQAPTFAVGSALVAKYSEGSHGSINRQQKQLRQQEHRKQQQQQRLDLRQQEQQQQQQKQLRQQQQEQIQLEQHLHSKSLNTLKPPNVTTVEHVDLSQCISEMQKLNSNKLNTHAHLSSRMYTNVVENFSRKYLSFTDKIEHDASLLQLQAVKKDEQFQSFRRYLLVEEIEFYMPPTEPKPTPLSYLKQYILFLAEKAAHLIYPNKNFLELYNAGDKKVEKVILVSALRSGSSYMGDLIASHPLVFYIFEPLGPFVENAQLRTEVIGQFLNCNFSIWNTLPNVGGTIHFTMQMNRLLNNILLNMTDIKQKVWFAEQVCSQYRLRSIKTVRTTLSELEPLIREQPSIQTVFLARDPRATANSRDEEEWCDDECRDDALLCKSLLKNTLLAKTLQKQYPNRFKLIRLEFFLIDVVQSTVELYKFLQWPIEEQTLYFLVLSNGQSQNIAKYIQNLECMDRVLLFSERIKDESENRGTKNDVSSDWRLKISMNRTQVVEKLCKEPMNLLEYIIVHNEEQLRDKSYPLIKIKRARYTTS